MHVQRFSEEYLPQLRELVNIHLGAVVPGWALPASVIAHHLERDEMEYVTDSWVIARETICAVEGWRVLAAAHLLRYGDGPDVGEMYREVGEICWFLAFPKHLDAAAAVLASAHGQLSAWGGTREHVCGYGGLPVPAFGGVPDTWPHIASALTAAGYRPGMGHREALYGGALPNTSMSLSPPIDDLTVRRGIGPFGTRFSAMRGDEEVGHCECVPDLTHGGELPALAGWAELAELWVNEEWRSCGIGRWLVQHAITWMRLAGCDRIVLAVDAADEVAGAGRFYRRYGWDVLARETREWTR